MYIIVFIILDIFKELKLTPEQLKLSYGQMQQPLLTINILSHCCG